MKQWAPLVCLLAVLCGCGGDKQSEAVADAKRQAHGLAASDLLVLQALERGDVSPRFAREHLRDSRRNLDEIRKSLKDNSASGAEQLVQQFDRADHLLKQLQESTDDRARVVAAAGQLQQVEAELREAGR
jgi:hypothetical protein